MNESNCTLHPTDNTVFYTIAVAQNILPLEGTST
jgi:hypothetical protein